VPQPSTTTPLHHRVGAAKSVPADARGAGRAQLRVLRDLTFLGLLMVGLWLPRLRGPIDLRFDAGVYYVLGASLAEGKGYRLLNEPGEIEAIQYPPLLPLLTAAHIRILGSSDAGIVAPWLRIFLFVLFVGCGFAIYALARSFLAPVLAISVAAISMMQTQVIWLSDLLFAEIPFVLTSVLFLISARRSGRRWASISGALAVASFLLRSIGIALLAAWVGESLLRRHWGSAALRGAIAIIPVLGWQAYIAHVKGSTEYAQPAYAYQRAAYQFYNVSYSDNLRYADPFAPELGEASAKAIVGRTARNLAALPAGWGQAVSVEEGWAKLAAITVNAWIAPLRLPAWSVNTCFILLGLGAVFGLLLLARRKEYLICLYVLLSVAAIYTTPWPGQFPRYLAPLTPVLALSLFVALNAVRGRLNRTRHRARYLGDGLVAGIVLAIFTVQFATLHTMYSFHHHTATYTDQRGRTQEFRLFYYPRPWQLHTAALEWLRQVAQPNEIIGTWTPHWAFLRTGLPAVMPPFVTDSQEAQRLVESVPLEYLLVAGDEPDGYALPLVQEFPERWRLIYATPDSVRMIYRRVPADERSGSP
jgi:hypothetical protein